MALEIVDKFNTQNEDGSENRINIYKMTANSAEKTSFKEFIDQDFMIKSFVVFKDIEKDKLILSILTQDGTVLSGDSKTLRDSLYELHDTFEAEIVNMYVYIKADVSKNNRTFLTLCIH